jgi:hypothetical protein
MLSNHVERPFARRIIPKEEFHVYAHMHDKNKDSDTLFIQYTTITRSYYNQVMISDRRNDRNVSMYA